MFLVTHFQIIEKPLIHLSTIESVSIIESSFDDDFSVLQILFMFIMTSNLHVGCIDFICNIVYVIRLVYDYTVTHQ